jgi:hypothetical protein
VISRAVKDFQFIYFLLRDIDIDVEFLIVLKTDNIDGMFMALTGVRTRHVDTQCHCIREIVEEIAIFYKEFESGDKQITCEENLR